MEFFDCNSTYGIFSVPPYKRADSVGILLEEMEWCGINSAMVRHAAMIDESPIVGNPLLVEQIKPYPNLEPSWGILPSQTGELGNVDDFIASMKKNQVKALWAYPAKHRYLLNDTTFSELFEEMIIRNIPLFLERNESCGGNEWAIIDSVLKDFPKIIIILVGHGSWGEDRFFRPFIEKYDGFYTDTSRYELDGGIADFCKTYGSYRLLFGTSFPRTPMGGAMLTLMHADIKDSEREAIARGNLKRILSEVKL
ncbi:hypothetical protein FJZ33_04175 [Candidatus Poribacteria bacterium]|nr:hypothetical protein [Candidatus Poribacteria bacterium]